MDPDATFALINDEDTPDDERAQAALDLLTWSARGGFEPSEAKSAAFVIDRCNTVLAAALDRKEMKT